MRKYRKWVLTLGLMVATPGIASANPLSKIFGKSSPRSAPVVKKQQQVRRTNVQRPSNQHVANGVAHALRSAKLNGYEMNIEVKNGVCTLLGKIGSAQQKANAARITRSVKGVQRVENRLQVIRQASLIQRVGHQAGKPSAVRRMGHTQTAQPQSAIVQNQQVAEQIAKTLRSAGLSDYDISVRYQNGLAMLVGSVASPQQRAQAGQIVRQVPGVQQVNNQLSVGQQAAAQQGMPPQQGMRQPVMPARYAPGPGQAPQGYGHPGPQGGRQVIYNQSNLPETAWPSYAAYPNSAQVAYPKQYSANAWPYIGPFHPYPQVPLGWREAKLSWEDGSWNLKFNSRTDKWWWFLNPKNW